MPPRDNVTKEDIQRAAEVVKPVARETPILTSRSLDDLVGCHVLFKAENLQRTGSFKVRGATHKIATLTAEQRARGVIAASAGNHAQGVALAARQLGVHSLIVMPQGASLNKIKATQSYGAEVLLHGDSYDDAETKAHALAAERGLAFLHAFDDHVVIAGQGTLGLELCHQVDDMDTVVVPVGGGGLIAGVATAVKSLRPHVKVIGVQVEAAPAVARSFHAKRRIIVKATPTIADGIAVGKPGVLPLKIMRHCVDDVVTVTEEEVAWAMVLLLERAKLLVEGAGAVGLAALLSGRLATADKKVVTVLSGGNVDSSLLWRVLDNGLARQGRLLLLSIRLRDVPGQLAQLLKVLADTGANVLEVTHHRRGLRIPPGYANVEIVVETRDPEHAALLTQRLEEHNYPFSQLHPDFPIDFA